MHRAPSICLYPGFQSALRGKYISNLWEEETLTGVFFSSPIFNSLAALVNSKLVYLLSAWIPHVTSLTITECRQFFEKPLHVAKLLTSIFLDNYWVKKGRLTVWVYDVVVLLRYKWRRMSSVKSCKLHLLSFHAFFFLFIGRKPTTWPANSCLK